MLIPMALARPDRAYFYATLCTLTSVAGGVLGYVIGYLLYNSLGLWLMQLYGYGDKVEAFRQAYASGAPGSSCSRASRRSPTRSSPSRPALPTIPSSRSLVLSIIARGMRFYLVAFLLSRYGPRARVIIEERLTFWVTLSLGVLVVGIVAAVYLF